VSQAVSYQGSEGPLANKPEGLKVEAQRAESGGEF